MEHKKGISNEFFPDDDFERMLEEKTKGWQSQVNQSVTEILDSTKATNQISDRGVLRHIEQAAVQTISSANAAAVESSQATSSTETPDVESPSKSPVVSDASESAELSNETVTELSTDDAKHLISDPSFTRNIIEGKTQQVVIRGIAKGPWANQHVELQTVSQDKALEDIGQPKLADLWRAATSGAKLRGRDIEWVSHRITLITQAAFYQEVVKHALIAHLDHIIETGNEEERARAEKARTKAYMKQSRLSKPTSDAGENGVRVPKAPKTVKPKTEKMLVKTQEMIDLLATYGLNQDAIIEKLKVANQSFINTPTLEYIRAHVKK